ncbi:WecB/TagA/CpsF family glycosyltransferase [Caldisericum exile]|uniref:Glycosyltransferase n=1 Tax=Caldisericum exile (strain DSM 21853 / NBRC 104410 / AZM16c01) TaxID=511051 RepID=A0A7U6GEF5_CALEA|nr:WecB/TagA/CpsF family glycosyltransferase [Caldisericum exile]BAL80882.1 putative glycosyltransferase [Caldisericum exile AZM16c01]
MRIEIFDIPVDNLTKEEAIKYIENLLEEDKPHFAVAINPEKAMKAYNDNELHDILKNSHLNFIDGVGIIFAAKLFKGIKIKERLTGIDLFTELLKVSEEKGYKVYFLGTKEESIKKAIENIKNSFPNLKIAGFHNGYFEDEEKIVETIAKSDADILFVGMGSPKQEKFIYKNLGKLNVKFAMGVGGTFNVYANEFRRAPHIIQKLGFEWLYRFVLDPKRLPRILSLPTFLKEAFKRRFTPKKVIEFLGIKVSNRTIEENLEIVEQFIKEKKFHLIVTINGEMLSRAISEKDFLNILKGADLVIPDGIGVVLGAKRFGERITQRIPGIEFAWELLNLAEKRQYKVFFLGAKEDILQSAIKTIKENFPNLQIVGSHNGYFTNDREIRDIIRNSKPDILFVGMGGIKQEKWIVQNKDLDVPVNIGIGGSFDVWSGKVKRAPSWVRKLGIEWLYRTVTQPERIFRLKNLIVLSFKLITGRIED